MDNSFGAGPPWPGPNQFQQGTNPPRSTGMEPQMVNGGGLNSGMVNGVLDPRMMNRGIPTQNVQGLDPRFYNQAALRMTSGEMNQRMDPEMQQRLLAMNGYNPGMSVRPGLPTPNSAGGDNQMWDMDNSNQMSMQTMNFERLMGAKQAGGQNFQQALSQQSMPMRDQSPLDNSIRVMTNRAGNDSQHRSEAGLDLIEQQQAMEQTRLLQRFKELRNWQQQQQEMLMSQQQQQLSVLRKEQNRVQGIITKQRDQQWGGGHPNSYTEMSTPPRRQLPAGMDMAQLMASGLFSQGQGQTQGQGQNRGTLPRPVIYQEPQDNNDDDERKTNPDLFSDTNSNRGGSEVCSQMGGEEGMFPIPDSASEASVDVGGDYHHRMQAQSQAIQHRFNPHELDAPKKLHRSFAELEADEDFINQSCQSPTLLDMQHQKSQLHDSRSVPHHDRDGLDRVEESDEDANHDDIEESDEESYELEDESQEDTQIEVHADTGNLDEMPIKPGVEGSKTFEQMLEEQLQAEEERLQQMNMNEDSPSQPKRTFLKKGQGLARFEVKPGSRPPRSKKTQKNNNNNAKSTSSTTQKPAQATQKSTSGVATSKTGKTSNKPPVKPSKSSSNTTVKSSSQQKLQQKTEQKGKKAAPKSPAKDSKPTAPSATADVNVSQVVGKKNKAESFADDASFIANINQRQKESEADMQDLDEFEILEHFADNMSFCSNSSIVTKGLRGLQSDRILPGVVPKAQGVGRPIDPRAALIKKLEHEQQAKIGVKPLNRQTVHNKQEPHETDNLRPHKAMNRKVAETHKTTSVNSVDNNGDMVKANLDVVKDTNDDDDDSDEYESVSDSDETDDDSDNDNDHHKMAKTVKTRDDQYLNHGSHKHEIAMAKGFGYSLKVGEHDTNSRNDSVLSTDKKLERVLSYTGFTASSVSQASDNDQNLGSDEEDDDELSTGYDAVEDRSPSKILTRKVAGKVDWTRSKPNIAETLSSGTQNTDNFNNGTDLLTASFNTSSFAPNAKSPIVISKEKVGTYNFRPDLKEETKYSYHSDTDSTGNRLKDSYSDDDKSEIGDGQAETKREIKSCGSEKKTLQFDDDGEWGDLTPKTDKHGRTHSCGGDNDQDRTLIDEEDTHSKAATTGHKGDDTPPTSKLVSKLFPKLKPQQKKQEDQTLQKLQTVSQSSVEDGVQSKILRDKLLELEREIEKFRNENTHLAKLRTEREEALSKLKKEIADFEKEKSDELKRLEEFKTEEMKKLKHERKMFDKYQKAARAGPDKKEREEIEMLKSQFSELQDEMKRKEGRWTSNTGRLRSRIEQVEQENDELKEEIKILERKRLEALQKDTHKPKTRPVNENPLRSSTPTDDLYDTDHQVTNGYMGQHPINDLSATSSIRSTSNVKPSQGQAKVNIHSSYPPGQKQSNIPHPPQNNANLSGKSTVSQNSVKGNQTKRNITQNSKAGHSVQGHTQNKAGSKAGAKTSVNSAKTGNQSDKNVLRTSLAEDVPRRVLTSMAAPQDISIYSEADGGDVSINPTNLPRKFAPRVNMDKSIIDKGNNSFDETQHSDGKIERGYSNGAREILFSNGTRKEISTDGKSIVVSFFNGDCKQILPDQRVVYYYADAQTTHTSYPDGLEILQFPNQQTEKLYPDGTKEITFPDQTVKYIFPNGSEESIFADGTVIRLEKNGDKTMEFPNGQREIHTHEYKRREYPDGTVKTVYPDGRQETRYSNGRLRVKDKDGNVIVDRLC